MGERAGVRPAPLMAMVMAVVGVRGRHDSEIGASNRHRFDALGAERVQVSDIVESETCTRLGVAPLGYVGRKVARNVIAPSQRPIGAVEPCREGA